MAAKKTAEEVVPAEYTVEDARSLSRMEGFTDDELRRVTSFEDAFKLAQQVYGEVSDVSEELGNGFTLISNKGKLVGVPFIVLSCGFNEGDYGDYVTVAAVTKSGDKYIFNDGSSGVFSQMFELVRTLRRTGGFVVPGGLRDNEYDTCTNCNRGRPKAVKVCKHEGCGDTSEKRASATTYYLDLASE